jgi:general secretion pathway protein G
VQPAHGIDQSSVLGRHEGFTLVELLIVLMIISILAAATVPRLSHRSVQARTAVARMDVGSNIPLALDLYELDTGMYPTTSQGLEALIRMPSTPPLPTLWDGPYLSGSVPRDPWGQPYEYRSPCNREECDYELWSLGPDGRQGGDDDIGQVVYGRE